MADEINNAISLESLIGALGAGDGADDAPADAPAHAAARGAATSEAASEATAEDDLFKALGLEVATVSEPAPESESASVAESEPEPTPEPEPEAASVPEPEPESEAVPASEPAPEAIVEETQVDVAGEFASSVQPESASEPESASTSEPEPEPETELVVEEVQVGEPDSALSAEAVAEEAPAEPAAAAPEPEPEPALKPKPEPETAPVSAAAPKPEPTPAPAATPEPTPAPAATPEPAPASAPGSEQPAQAPRQSSGANIASIVLAIAALMCIIAAVCLFVGINPFASQDGQQGSSQAAPAAATIQEPGTVVYTYVVKDADGVDHDVTETATFGEDGLLETSELKVKAGSQEVADIILADMEEQFGENMTGGQATETEAVCTITLPDNAYDRDAYAQLLADKMAEFKVVSQ